MEIKTREISNISIFDIKGELRRSESIGETLHQLVKKQLDTGKLNILLNLKGVTFIDSFGVIVSFGVALYETETTD